MCPLYTLKIPKSQILEVFLNKMHMEIGYHHLLFFNQKRSTNNTMADLKHPQNYIQ